MVKTPENIRGGEEGRAGELAQAAGTTGAQGPRSPGGCKRAGLHLQFRTASAPQGESTLQEGERPPTTSCTWAGWSHLPSTGMRGCPVGLYPRKKSDPFLVNYPVLGGSPEPTAQLPGKEEVPHTFREGLTGPFRVHPQVFPVLYLQPPSTVNSTRVRRAGGRGTTS